MTNDRCMTTIIKAFFSLSRRLVCAEARNLKGIMYEKHVLKYYMNAIELFVYDWYDAT